jgi:hypothetical protein
MIDFPPVVLELPYPLPTPDDPYIDRTLTEALEQLPAPTDLLEREAKRRRKA